MPPRTKEEEEDSGTLNLKTCVPECGALILRGNRVVLCRSLEDGDDPTVMHIPSCELDTEDEEDPLSCALRAVYEKCEIDEPEENITYLSQLPPMRLFSPRKVVDVYFFYANNPPPSIDDTSEEEDFEDAYVVLLLIHITVHLSITNIVRLIHHHRYTRHSESLLISRFALEHRYDWYTFPFAMKALQRNKDFTSAQFLKAVACILNSAASNSNAIENKWGGLFGMELFEDKVE